MEREVPWSKLPRLFQDAITLTREIGLQFIWIDCLCIVQDDRSEWETEAPKMSLYYSESYLTIAATRCKNPSEGLLCDRPITNGRDSLEATMFTSEPMEIQVTLGEKRRTLYMRPKFHDARMDLTSFGYVGVHSLPLMERAWVFQERVLARRTIHFHPREMVFECQELLTCECDAHQGLDTAFEDKRQIAGLRTRLPHPDLPVTVELFHSVMDCWLDIVSEYASKQITRETDRLPALSGLACQLAKQFETKYLAGLWMEDLPRQLLWETNVNLSDDGRPKELLAPNWSWASLQLSTSRPGYSWVQEPGFRVDWNVQVVKAWTRNMEKNPFGSVHLGHIHLRAKSIRVEIGLHDFGLIPLQPFLLFEDQIEGLKGRTEILTLYDEETSSEDFEDEERESLGEIKECEEENQPSEVMGDKKEPKGKERERERSESGDRHNESHDQVHPDTRSLEASMRSRSPSSDDDHFIEVPVSSLSLDLQLTTVNDELFYDGESLQEKRIYCVLLGHGRPSYREERFDVDFALVVSSVGRLRKDSCKRMGIFRISSFKRWFDGAKVSDVFIV